MDLIINLQFNIEIERNECDAVTYVGYIKDGLGYNFFFCLWKLMFIVIFLFMYSFVFFIWKKNC